MEQFREKDYHEKIRARTRFEPFKRSFIGVIEKHVLRTVSQNPTDV